MPIDSARFREQLRYWRGFCSHIELSGPRKNRRPGPSIRLYSAGIAAMSVEIGCASLSSISLGQT
jgi:hypothetical protein